MLLLALGAGVGLGALLAVAGHSFDLVGLQPLVSALAGSQLLVFAAHLLDVRRSAAHLAAAASFAATFALSGAVVDATLLRQRLARDLSESGALLEDPALLRAQGEAGAARLATAQGGAALAEAVLDERLRVDTGRDGLRGALALRLQSGLPMLRVGAVTRVLPMPPELQLAFLAATAAMVALLCARALESMRQEPRCPTCDGPLRFARLAAVSEAGAAALQFAFVADHTAAAATSEEVEVRPANRTLTAVLAAHPGRAVALERGVCPRGCPGALLELRRMRGRGLQLRRPGPVGRLRVDDGADAFGASADA